MNKSKALDPTSAAFLFTEKRTTPMHIAVLGIYKIPKGSDEAKFLQRLVDTVGDIERFRFPFWQPPAFIPNRAKLDSR